MKKQIISTILAAAMTASFVTVPAFAAESKVLSDIQGHEAESIIKSWVEYGVLRGGNDGKFHPDDTLTRAQMAAILNRMIGYQEKGENSYSDLASGAWYTDDMLYLAGASVLKGSYAAMRPDAVITYQEAVVMIARALELEDTDKVPAFEDYTAVAAWAKGAVNALAACGALEDRGAQLRPQENITRAETLQILDRLVANFVNTPGTYSKNTEGNLLVNAKDVTLKDMTITGNLIVADGVADGDVSLDNVKVEGEVILRGCGANSFHILPGTEVKSVTVTKTAGGVIRLVNESGQTIPMVFVNDGKSGVTIEGKFEKVDVLCDTPVAFGSGDVGRINVLTPNADVTIAKDTSVTTVSVYPGSDGSKVDIAGSVKDLAVSAPGKITNSGKVTNVKAEAKDVQWDGNKPSYVDKEGFKPVGSDGKDISGSAGSGLSSDSDMNLIYLPRQLAVTLASPVAGAKPEDGVIKVANCAVEVHWRNEDGTAATLSPEGEFLPGKTYVAMVTFLAAHNVSFAVGFLQNAPETYIVLTDKNADAGNKTPPAMKLEEYKWPWTSATLSFTYPATDDTEAAPGFSAEDLKIKHDVTAMQGQGPGENQEQWLYTYIGSNISHPGAKCQWYKTTAEDTERTKGTAIPGETGDIYSEYNTETVGEQYFYCVYTYNGREYTSTLGKVTVIEMPKAKITRLDYWFYNNSYEFRPVMQEGTVIQAARYYATVTLKGTYVGETEEKVLMKDPSIACYFKENLVGSIWLPTVFDDVHEGFPDPVQKRVSTITEIEITLVPSVGGAEHGDTITKQLNISYEYPESYETVDTTVTHGTFTAVDIDQEDRAKGTLNVDEAIKSLDSEGKASMMLRPANSNTELAKLDPTDPLALADARDLIKWMPKDGPINLSYGDGREYREILSDSQNGCKYLAVNYVTVIDNGGGSYSYKISPTFFVDVVIGGSAN